jgi:hypothetical protein
MTPKLSMQYAERLPALPSARTMVVPVVALAIGAAAATGAFALLDDESTGTQATAPKVIVADPPAQPSAGVRAKNEAGVAAAIGNPAVGPATESKDEAGTAAAIGQASGGTESRDSAPATATRSSEIPGTAAARKQVEIGRSITDPAEYAAFVESLADYDRAREYGDKR